MNSVYKITDAGLQALVTGVLKVERDLRDDSVAAHAFKVQYDSIVFSPMRNTLGFVYDGCCFMEVELPNVGAGDTLTVNGLEGKAMLNIS